MRDRIESVADILMAAAHADHHVEPEEMREIESILRGIWATDPSPVLRPVSSLEGDEVKIGGIVRELEPRDDGPELPTFLVQRLADFDPERFDVDEAVGPFLHEGADYRLNLLRLAVRVHESDGELDFAEDTFIRELGYKLGLEEAEFKDLLLEFVPDDNTSARAEPATQLEVSRSRTPLPETETSQPN